MAQAQSAVVRATRAVLVLASVLWTASACARHALVVSAVDGLPRYTPAESQVFDDSLSPWIVGIPGETVEPASDPKLIERTQHADTVVRAKLATIGDAAGNGFVLAARAVADPLAGNQPDPLIELRVGNRSRSASLVSRYRHSLVGRTVILFVKRYNDRGTPKTHWYASVDARAVVDAVKRARIPTGS